MEIMEKMNVQEAIELCNETLETKQVESPRLSAEILTAHVTNMTRSEILYSLDRSLSNTEESRLKVLLQRRAKHEPIPYIIGEVEFYSIPLTITNGVFIPRPETETLIEKVLEVAKTMEKPKIYDLGTGSGNIIITLALHLEDGEFWGSDISNNAIKIAQKNVLEHDLASYVTLKEGPLFSPLRNELSQDFDILVSNPPYVKSQEIQKLTNQIKDFEPIVALDGGRDGMTFIRSLLDGAPHILKSGGYIFLEADPTLMLSIRTEVRRRKGFSEFTIHKDASDKERVCQFRVKK